MSKTKSNSISQLFKKSSEGMYVRNAAYIRPRYFVDQSTQKFSIERYGCYDHARDEARTAVTKIIYHCDRNGYGIEGFINEVLEMELQNKNSYATEIVRAIPPTVFQVAIDSILEYEKVSKKPVTSALSIRPKVGSDKQGYFVKRIEIIDSPTKVARKYKGNYLKRAF